MSAAKLNECAGKLRASADAQTTSAALVEYRAAAQQLRESLAPSPQRQIADMRRENAAMRRELEERAELIAAHSQRLLRWQAACTDIQAAAQTAAEVAAREPDS